MTSSATARALITVGATPAATALRTVGVEASSSTSSHTAHPATVIAISSVARVPDPGSCSTNGM